MSVPYYPFQTVDQWPAYARGQNGVGQNGSFGVQLDVRGGALYTCMSHRLAMPKADDLSVEARIVAQNQMNVVNNGYEGVTVQLRLLRVINNVLTEVWNNNVITNGDPADWRAENRVTDWIEMSWFEQLPANIGADFLDVTIITKGTSGQLNIDSVYVRNRYERRYFVDVLGPTGGAVQYEVFRAEDPLEGKDQAGYVKYVRTTPCKINSGERISIEAQGEFKGGILGLVGDPNALQRQAIVGLLLKLRRRTGEYDYVFIAEFGADNHSVQEYQTLQNSVTTTAEHEYTQFETLVYVRDREYRQSEPNRAAITARNLDVRLITRGFIQSG